MKSPTAAFQLDGIQKSFPGTVAVAGVSLVGRRSEIVGLVGENGAGKSTLMKILAGIYPRRSFRGTVQVNGHPAAFKSVIDAEKEGIVLIPQELVAVPSMSVAENLFLNREPANLGIVDFAAMQQEAVTLLSEFGLRVDPQTPMGRLSIAQQQVIEIAKALAKRASVLILDEPTSSLTAREAEVLFTHLLRLKNQGLCSVYISHRIDEVLRIVDRIVVLRDGRVVGEGQTDDIDAQEIVRLMIGRRLSEGFPKSARQTADPILELKNWSVRDPKGAEGWKLRDVSMSVAAGEVVGLFGAVGAGRSELLHTIVGAYPVKATGRLWVAGRERTLRSPRDALRVGIALVTEDRQKFGIEPWMDVRENLSLAVLKEMDRLGVIERQKESTVVTSKMRELRIAAASVNAGIRTLSGGNQQKVILGRFLLRRPGVLLLDEPTRGIDIGAKAEVYSLLDDLCSQGLAIVFVSSEVPEILGVTDRVIVLRRGQIVAEHRTSDASEEMLLGEAIGA